MIQESGDWEYLNDIENGGTLKSKIYFIMTRQQTAVEVTLGATIYIFFYIFTLLHLWLPIILNEKIRQRQRSRGGHLPSADSFLAILQIISGTAIKNCAVICSFHQHLYFMSQTIHGPAGKIIFVMPSVPLIAINGQIVLLLRYLKIHCINTVWPMWSSWLLLSYSIYVSLMLILSGTTAIRILSGWSWNTGGWTVKTVSSTWAWLLLGGTIFTDAAITFIQ